MHVDTTPYSNEGGVEAVQMRLAEQYMQAFSRLAKESTTVLLPANANSPASMVAQALSIFKQIGTDNGGKADKAVVPSAPAKREAREGGRVASAVGPAGKEGAANKNGGFSLQKA